MKHLTKTFKTLLALIALTTIFTFNSCSEDHFNNTYIVGNGNINGSCSDSLYQKLVINLYNKMLSKTKSIDSESAVNKYAVITDVKFIFFDVNDISIGEYYTPVSINNGVYPVDMNVPSTTTKILALCNRHLNAYSIAESSTVGKSYGWIENVEYDLLRQEDPINSVAVTGVTEGIDLNSGIVDIVVQPVVSRLEIASINVNMSEVDYSLYPNSIEIKSIFVHNIYEKASLSQNVRSSLIDINDGLLYNINSNGMLSAKNNAINYYHEIGIIGEWATPVNKVWGFQIMPVFDLVPNITVMVKLTYDGNIQYRYINVTGYNYSDGSGNDMEIPVDRFDRGMVYKVYIECPFSKLNTEPGIKNTAVKSTIKVVEWGEQEVIAHI